MGPAFITNINPTELMLIAIVAILIFGRRLPEVAGQAAGHVQRARRALNDLKRESGIEDELREVRRAMDVTANPQPKPAPGAKLPAVERPSQTIGRHESAPQPVIEAEAIHDPPLGCGPDDTDPGTDQGSSD